MATAKGPKRKKAMPRKVMGNPAPMVMMDEPPLPTTRTKRKRKGAR